MYIHAYRHANMHIHTKRKCAVKETLSNMKFFEVDTDSILYNKFGEICLTTTSILPIEYPYSYSPS